jgi:hypothetical protein
LIYINAIIDIAYFWMSFIILAASTFQIQRLYLIYLQKVGGRRLMLLPASFCVPCHELSHYLAAKISGHKVTSMSLFSPNKSGTLGFVEHSYKPTILSPFTNAFIGMAPLMGGFIVIYLFTAILNPDILSLLKMKMFVGSSDIQENALQFIDASSRIILTHYDKPIFWGWYVLVANIAVFSVPSLADFQGATKGIFILLIVYVLSVAHSGLTGGFHGFMVSLASIYVPILLLSVAMVGFTLMLLFVMNLMMTHIFTTKINN